MAKAVQTTVKFFEEDLGMEVSQTKSVMTATSHAAAKLGQTKRYATVGNGGKSHGEMLRVGTTDGARRTTTVQKSRLKQLNGKQQRYQTLKKAAFNASILSRITAMPPL